MPTAQDESTYFLQLLESASDILPKAIPPTVVELLLEEFRIKGFDVGINGLKRWLLEDNGKTFPNFKRLMELGGGYVDTTQTLEDAALVLASSCLNYLKQNFHYPDIEEYADKVLDEAQMRTLDLAGGLCYLAQRVTKTHFDELELNTDELKFVMNELKRCAVVVLKRSSQELIGKYLGVHHGSNSNQTKRVSSPSGVQILMEEGKASKKA